MYFYLHRNSKKLTFYSVKILKCESFLSALGRNSKKGHFYRRVSKNSQEGGAQNLKAFFFFFFFFFLLFNFFWGGGPTQKVA